MPVVTLAPTVFQVFEPLKVSIALPTEHCAADTSKPASGVITSVLVPATSVDPPRAVIDCVDIVQFSTAIILF